MHTRPVYEINRLCEIDGRTVYDLPPLREYLKALDVAAFTESAYQRFAVISGECGSGKTLGAETFIARGKPIADNLPCYIAVPAESLLSSFGLLSMIARELGVAIYERSPLSMADEIAARGYNEPRLIIVDDAHRLRRGGNLELLQWMSDNSRLVFALVGPPALEHHVARNDQLASRVMLRYRLRPPTVEEIGPLFDGFPPEIVAKIHAETAGNMRRLLALRERILRVIEENDLKPSKLAPKQVQAIASRFLMKVA